MPQMKKEVESLRSTSWLSRGRCRPDPSPVSPQNSLWSHDPYPQAGKICVSFPLPVLICARPDPPHALPAGLTPQGQVQVYPPSYLGSSSGWED